MPGRIRSFLFVAHIYYANLQDKQVNRCIYSIETDWRHVHCTLYVHSSVCIYSGLCISTTCTKLVHNLTITNCYIHVSQQSYNAKIVQSPSSSYMYLIKQIFFSKIVKQFYKYTSTCIFIYPTLILF